MMSSWAALSLLALAFAIAVIGKAEAEYEKPPPPPPPPPKDLKCKPDEIKGCRPCGSDKCADIFKPKEMCSMVCIDACVCKDGHLRQDGKCVPIAKCKVNCPENSVLNPKAPEPITCANLYAKPASSEPPKPRCVCKPGYILREKSSSKCVKVSECKTRP